ncbi:uncharacterized protein LOC108112300 [Drosophila eugracilis]|uniref:uncharacterized protein LOC108112300 n=1 Tax=Drosophila eugracilis TaxID=29029 RepID=UPI0007E64D05|nr:uncharacterized protein LOC108112300 [Drosophila eugracilis]
MDESVSESEFIGNIERTVRSTLMRGDGQSIHRELIDYATASCRMFYIQDASAWQEWSTNVEAFQDISAQEACNIFLTEVLPQLDTYQVPDTMKKRFKLLDLHPFFRRVDQGYQYTPDCDLADRFVLHHHQDFLLTNDVQKTREIESAKRCQTVLLDKEEMEQQTCVGYRSKVSLESAVLFSVLLSSDMELSIAQMLDLDEIHQRLRRAKQSFEDTARLSPYRNNIDDLIFNVDCFAKVKSKICQAMSDCKKY